MGNLWCIMTPDRERKREKKKERMIRTCIFRNIHSGLACIFTICTFNGNSLLYRFAARACAPIRWDSRARVCRWYAVHYTGAPICIVLAEDRLMAIDLHYANWLASESSCLFARHAYRQYRSHVHSREDSRADPTWKVPLFYDNVLHRYVEARAEKRLSKSLL